MAYENATAPLPLPSHSIVTYPYTIMCFLYAEGAKDWGYINYYCATAPFVWDGASVVKEAGVEFKQFTCQADTWEEVERTADTTITVAPGVQELGMYCRIYTDHNICDSNGDVQLAEYTTTAYKYDLKAFLIGLALGLSGRPLPPQAEPTAYLYNGVQLPKLPEWDTGAYPYAFIVTQFGSSSYPTYYFIASKVAPIYSSNDYGDYWSVSSGASLGTSWSDYSGTVYEDDQPDAWEDISERDAENGLTLGWEDGSYKRTILWCSIDMVRPDGTVFLAASEPIPVYE